MSKYAEIRSDYFHEEGTVIAKVNPKTGDIEYLDEDARKDFYAQQEIRDVLERDYEME